MNHLSKLAMLAVVGGALVGSQAHAAGYEKANMWGGKEAAVAGAISATASGSNALYFNPAGLAGKAGDTASINISPTSSQFKGPINNVNAESESQRTTTFPFALTYARSDEDFGYGFGAFVSGGSTVDFGDVDFGTATGVKPNVKSAISVLEVSAGAGYKVNDDLKVGLAWRAVMAQADFNFAIRKLLGANHNGVANAKLSDLKDTQYLAFRGGAQYKLSETMDLGLTFRTEVNFKVKGTGSGQVSSFVSSLGAANPALPTADVTASTTFPMQIALGVTDRCDEDWMLMAQYEFTQYSRVGELIVEGGTFASTNNETRLQTDWRDQHLLRLGAEYKAASWPVRFGYAFGPAVTNPDYAKATFTPPGWGHSVTVGTGTVMDNLSLDGTLEYSFSSADVSGKAASGTTSQGSDTRNGSYSASAFVAHIGASYAF